MLKLKEDSIIAALRVSLKQAAEAGHDLYENNPEGYKVASKMVNVLKDERDPIKIADIATALKVIFDLSSITSWRPAWIKIYNGLDYLRYSGGYINPEICTDSRQLEKLATFGEYFDTVFNDVFADNAHEVYVYSGKVYLCPVGTSKTSSVD